MDLLEAIKLRHSVRSFINKKIEGETLKQLQQIITEYNKESNLNIQLHLNEPTAFTGFLAKYGNFKNVKNYITIVSKKNNNSEEKCGYYGEKIVLKSVQLGLNTC